MMEGIGTRAPRARFAHLRVLPFHQLVWEYGPCLTRGGTVLIGHNEANHGVVRHILAKLIQQCGFKIGGRRPICHNLIGRGRDRHAFRYARRELNQLCTNYHVGSDVGNEGIGIGITCKSGHCSVFRFACQNRRGQGSCGSAIFIGRGSAAESINSNTGSSSNWGLIQVAYGYNIRSRN